MNKIKITYVVTNFRISGPINQTLYIIKNLDLGKFEPSVVAMFDESEETYIDRYKEIDVKIYQLHLTKKQSLLIGKKKVNQILNEIQPDIIQAVGIPPYRMTLGYTKCKHLVTLRNYCYEDYPFKYGKIKGLIMAYLDVNLMRKQIAKEEPFVTCSNSLSVMYREKLGMTFDYIQNGVDVTRFTVKDMNEVASLRNKLCLPIDKIIFVYSGNMIERKNQEEAIKGFLNSDISHNAVLLLLGDGVKYQYLKAKYKSTNIIFTGKVSNVPEYLRASDVYVSTSSSEGLPNGVLEAMAVGLPIILSNIPQHREVMGEDVGFTYMLGNIDNLSECFNKMMASDMRIIGSNARVHILKNLTDKIMSEKYQQLYRHILGM